MTADTLVGILGIIVAILALIIPAVAIVAHRMGRVSASAESAHHRLDSLEERLANEFKDLGLRIETAMEQAWHRCPVAQQMSSAEELVKRHK